MRTTKRSVCVMAGMFCALWVLSACGDSPDPTNLIVKARVLGMLSSVEGNPSRTAARPGETVNLELLLTQPGRRQPNTYAFVVCRPQPAVLGAATCLPGIEPVALVIRNEPSETAPRFSVTIPDDAESNLLLVGALCMGGQVRNDLMGRDLREALNPCDGEGFGQLITGAVFVQNPEREINHVPTIEDIRFDEMSWEAEPPAELTDCIGRAMPQVYLSDDRAHILEVHAVPGSREPFHDPLAAPPGPDVEDLPVAVYVTELGLRGHYSVIDAEPGEDFEGATPVASLEFSTKKIEDAPGPEGRVIRFEIVMRDDHGGVSHASRAVCLLP